MAGREPCQCALGCCSSSATLSSSARGSRTRAEIATTGMHGVPDEEMEMSMRCRPCCGGSPSHRTGKKGVGAEALQAAFAPDG